MSPPTITVKQLEQRLRGIVGQVAISLVTLTEPAMRKTGNPFLGRIVKRSELEVYLGSDYETRVNELRKEENRVADFEAKPRKWGERVGQSPLVKHEGKTYVSADVERVICTRYVVDGRIIPTAEVEPYLAKRSEEAPTQGLSRPVIRRDFKLDSIAEIEFPDGERYVVGR